MEKTTATDGIEAQRRFLKGLEEMNFGWDLMVGDAFVRGMRDIGYKSTSFAMAELIDNSIQAAASRVDVVFGFDGGNKPAQIAIIDDGHGMEPGMVRASLVWGAGTRAENREGFGKYGYGLPSASVSQCHRVTVYSKTEGTAWHSAYIDIDEIGDAKWTKGNRIEMPAEKAEEPPKFVIDFLKKQKRWESFTHGSVVVWEHLDRIDFKIRDRLRSELVTQLGVIYRNYLRETPMTVDGVNVEPCDPLFLTPGFRYYDLDEDRAIPFEPADVEIMDKDTGEVMGHMRVRYARFPATFFRKPEFKDQYKVGRGDKNNERLEIANANNGIIFMRNGRQIDVLRPPRKLGSINATTDRFWMVEVDFDATLDEFFSITTSKQQVSPDEKVWDWLKDRGNLFAAIGQMRTEYKKEAKVIQTKADEERDKKKASIEAIEAAKKFKTHKPPEESPQRQKEAQENLEQESKKRAQKAGVKPEVIERELIARQEGNPLVIEEEDMPGAPFYRAINQGGQYVLYLNVAHPFYQDLYAGPQSTPRLRAGLEVLLWALAESEIDADPDSDRRKFYVRERASVWSPYIEDALNELRTISIFEDADGVNEDDGINDGDSTDTADGASAA